MNEYNGNNQLTKTAAQQELLTDAVKALGKQDEDLKKVFQTTEYEVDARMAFKHATSRGVTGAPFFFINDVLVDDVPESKEKLVQLLLKYV